MSGICLGDLSSDSGDSRTHLVRNVALFGLVDYFMILFFFLQRGKASESLTLLEAFLLTWFVR